MSEFTVDIYWEEQSTPGVFTLIPEADDFNAAVGQFGWQPDDPGTYRFRVELYEDLVFVSSALTDYVTFGRARTMTAEMALLLGARQRRDRTWLYVEDGDGTQQDRSAFLTGYEVVYHRDQRVGNATVRLRREHGSGTLAPLVETSALNKKLDGTYSPAIDKGRRFTIWVAPVAPDEVPSFADAFPIFCGRIDGIDPASSDMSFHGRDIGGRLVDTFIEVVRRYGAPEAEGGQPIQEMIQQILSDNTTEDGLYVPEDIDAEGGEIWIEKAFLLETVRNIALEAGADLRHLWRDSNGSFALTLYEPDRGGTEPEYVFGNDEWLEVTELKDEIDNIRNRVAGFFLDEDGNRWYVGIPVPANDPTAGDLIENSSFPGAASAGLLVDDNSEGKYGPRYSELGLDDTSHVRTLDAFERLQAAFIADLSESDVDLSIRTVFFWPAGLNRIYGFEADGIRWEEQKNFACVGYRHVYNAPQGNMDATFETVLTCRGKPAAAREEYVVKERPPKTRTPEVVAPPDPNAERFSSANVVNFNVYWVDPAKTFISWSIANINLSNTVSIDRSIDEGEWDEFITLLAPDAATQMDTIPGYTNRPTTTPPPITHSVKYRLRLLDPGDVLIDSRITNTMPLGPP